MIKYQAIRVFNFAPAGGDGRGEEKALLKGASTLKSKAKTRETFLKRAALAAGILAAFAMIAFGGRPAAKPYEAHVATHTHWDREWGFTEEQHKFNLVKIMDNLISIMENDPEYKYFTLDGQTSMADDYLALKPEMRPRVEKLVKDGRLLVGPFYVQLDEFLSSGEAQLRNLLYGVRAAEDLGGSTPIGYSSDNFGHNGQLPQLLRGFGIDAFVFSRGVNEKSSVYKGLFRWFAMDEKSWVYASPQPGGYGNFNWAVPVEGLAMAEASGAYLKTSPNAVKRVLLYNAGSDAEEPVFELPQVIKMINKKFPTTDLIFSNYRQYVDAVVAKKPKLEKFAGDLRGRHLLACITTRIPLKQANFKAYNLLERYAEPASALSWLETGREYPDYFIKDAWMRELYSLPHDSVTGTSFDRANRDIIQRFEVSSRISEQLSIRGFKTLIEAINSDDKGNMARKPVHVFNTLAWERNGIADMNFPMDDKMEEFVKENGFDDMRVETGDGKALPSHFFGFKGADSRLLFQAEKIPAMGYKTYYLIAQKKEGVSGRRAPEAAVNGFSHDAGGMPAFENEYYRAVFNADGSFNLDSKVSGRTYKGLHRFEDHVSPGSPWDYTHSGDGPALDTSGVKAKFEVIENSPARTVVRVDLSSWEIDSNVAGVGKTSIDLESYIMFYPYLERIDFYTKTANRARDHRLRVVFPSGAKTQTVWADSQFGVAERDVEKPNPMEDENNPEPAYPHMRFVDASDGEAGLAVFNRGQPEYQARKAADATIDLLLTLLRATGSYSEDKRMSIVENPWEPKDDHYSAELPGEYGFQYSVQAHAGDWRTGKINRAASEYATPLWPEDLNLNDAPKWQRGPGGAPVYYRYPQGYLDADFSFLNIDNPNIELSALKKAEDDDAIIIRVYNANARAESGKVFFYKESDSVAAVNMNERGVDERVEYSVESGEGGVVVTTTLNPYQIATFKIGVHPPQERPWFYTRY